MAQRSNCFVFAWWLYFTRGGYCALRRSRHIAGWHWLWSPDLKRWIHYEPNHSKPMPYAIWHKVWYHGKVKRGDA
jgi:hypothetical protein